MPKLNCWEFKKCGREPGGRLTGELGVCPASTYKALSGIHGGSASGRACWVIAGTFCGGLVQGTEAQKEHNCWKCDFFQLVRKEEETFQEFSATKLGMIRALERRPSS